MDLADLTSHRMLGEVRFAENVNRRLGNLLGSGLRAECEGMCGV